MILMSPSGRRGCRHKGLRWAGQLDPGPGVTVVAWRFARIAMAETLDPQTLFDELGFRMTFEVERVL
jgi:hypothetical protein